MSKFCPLANAVTNCTENCKYCLEEEQKEKELEMNTKLTPMRDCVEHYISGQPVHSLQDYAAIKLGVLTEMHIKLTPKEIEHLCSLKSEIQMDNFVHKLIFERL